MVARTVRIVVLGEAASSLKTVELGNWSGKAVFGPRLELAEALRTRKELQQPSVYFLLAPDPENPALRLVYIGEAEEFSTRVRDHERKKDWWEYFVVLGSTNSNLTKAHIRYLERWFYDRARIATHRVRVMNENTPPGSSLPESDLADIEEFGRNALFLLGVLGYPLFDQQGPPSQPAQVLPKGTRPGGEFEMLISRSHNWPDGTPAVARLRVEDGSYILLAGSSIRLDGTDSFHRHPYWKLWKKVAEDGSQIEKVKNEVGRLLVDIPFTSPSAAGAVVRARAVDGRSEWKLKGTGQTLDEWEAG